MKKILTAALVILILVAGVVLTVAPLVALGYRYNGNVIVHRVISLIPAMKRSNIIEDASNESDTK